jgi:urease accessory protein
MLLSNKLVRPLPLLGGVVSAAVAIHAMLHGQEASGTAGWWVGALMASAITIAISYGAGRQINQRQSQLAAAALALLGGALALAPL